MRAGFQAIIILLSLLCLSCNKTKREGHSFYYWKTSVSTDDTVGIKDFDAGHFYIRYFDVDWNGKQNMAVPVAGITLSQNISALTRGSFTPVVFITNNTFLHISPTGCDTLAYKVSKQIETITKQIKPATVPAEIQIDCDWTAGTKDKYFSFLKKLKQLNADKQLSVTIRLYPYKYREAMGVPPADKGVLMCYNLGLIEAGNTGNSVFDIKELEQYTGSKEYPLPLDIALPIFGWYVWFRGSAYKGIIYDDGNAVHDIATAKDGNHYIVQRDTVYAGKYLREGDILREEYPEEKELENAAQLLTSKVKYQRIIFYHWHKPLIKRYEHTIKDIFSRY